MKVGLDGEKLQIHSDSGSGKVQWSKLGSSDHQPLTWYKVKVHNSSLNLRSAKCGQNRIVKKSNSAQLTEIYILDFVLHVCSKLLSLLCITSLILGFLADSI